ncbi:hypothetical protein [Alkaliphilus peptidifermentans]|uniref:Flagellar operon protein TIGR03826 n=1 Tax=Alkaliphilus peptidifermentans DSM 18978 TaxID=1120976 RepID=A0A1G5KEC7_9FIRM|nr:hypothetical protein [Alkaliphilus peptidifermentans]SCY98418.1 hypothetical protein SAMN03080606_03390 [Alkaliphilus peptidifermentans DSM 18978]
MKNSIKGIKVKTCKKCRTPIHENTIYDYCSSCYRVVEEIFESIREYLREYPNSTAFEIEQRLGIPIHVVNNFVKDGRLIEIANEFLNLECLKCGCLLLSAHHKYCPQCEIKMIREMESAKDDLMGNREVEHKGKMRFKTYWK